MKCCPLVIRRQRDAKRAPPLHGWNYVNVRRRLTSLEDSIDRGVQWVVFERDAGRR